MASVFFFFFIPQAIFVCPKEAFSDDYHFTSQRQEKGFVKHKRQMLRNNYRFFSFFLHIWKE